MPRIWMALAVAGILSLFAFPMWKIVLYAPQYPQGVQMNIWINRIDGTDPGTLQNVNILNHYVGMKFIEPDAIPELSYFPWIILAMGLLGVVALLVNRPWAYMAWAILMIGLFALGVYDFYLWEYDYGHNLSSTAPIKIPGASFQPPLIGRKIILNFTAVSLPHIGGYLAGSGILSAILAWWSRKKIRS